MEYLWYFIIGGTIVSLSTYFGSREEGVLAAFITQFPSISVLAILLIYKTGGGDAVGKYVHGFLYVVPPWILYIVTVWFLCSRIGIFPSLILGISIYLSTSWLLMRSGY